MECRPCLRTVVGALEAGGSIVLGDDVLTLVFTQLCSPHAHLLASTCATTSRVVARLIAARNRLVASAERATREWRTRTDGVMMDVIERCAANASTTIPQVRPERITEWEHRLQTYARLEIFRAAEHAMKRAQIMFHRPPPYTNWLDTTLSVFVPTLATTTEVVDDDLLLPRKIVWTFDDEVSHAEAVADARAEWRFSFWPLCDLVFAHVSIVHEVCLRIDLGPTEGLTTR